MTPPFKQPNKEGLGYLANNPNPLALTILDCQNDVNTSIKVGRRNRAISPILLGLATYHLAGEHLNLVVWR